MADKHDYSEDMFEDTRMSFGDHLEELRLHLWKAISGFLVALFFSFFIGKPVLHMIAAPVTDQLRKFHKAHAAQVVKDLPSDRELQEANQPRFVKTSFLRKQIQSMVKGEPLERLLEPLPEQAESLAFGQLVERVHLDVLIAAEALEDNQWDKIETVTEDLSRIVPLLKNATDAPANYDPASLAKELSANVDDLRESIKDPVATVLALRRIDSKIPFDAIPPKALLPLWVRIDDPVLFFSSLHDAHATVSGLYDLATLSVQEAFMAYFKVCIACGIVIGSPWIFYQIWLFIAAGLYPHEKRLINVYLPFSVGLFLIGVAVCELFVLPRAIEALLWFNEWVGMKPDLRFNEWLGFAIMMPLVFGVSFQLPLVMMFIEKLGIFTVEQFKAQWRIALFIIHIFAALITPSVDLVSMELLAMPMFGLYWLGIFLCRFNDHSDFDMDVPDSEEMVEA